jgi:hypothetical protein
MFPIIGSHIKRLGWLRVIVGGGSMYLSVPMFVVAHLSIAVALYQWTLRPLFGVQRVRWADHVIIDRHRIEGLPFLDVFNCWFCGYANGLSTMINTEIDHLSRFSGRLPRWKTVLATVAVAVNLPFLPIADWVGIRLIYGVMVSRPLGMHRVSHSEVCVLLEREGYGDSFGAGRSLLLATKNTALRLSLALEQIESSWCPLQHFERRVGVVYPEHHKRFFGPHQLEEMRQVLSTVGTVSTRTS